MRVVLDANQFISGVLVSHGNPAKILDAWRDGRFKLLLSEFALQESGRVLRYPKIQKRLPWSATEIQAFLERLRDAATMVDVRSPANAIAEDPEDIAYQALAVAGGADCIVRGDQHLLKLHKYQGIQIVTAAAFLQDLRRASESSCRDAGGMRAPVSRDKSGFLGTRAKISGFGRSGGDRLACVGGAPARGSRRRAPRKPESPNGSRRRPSEAGGGGKEWTDESEDDGDQGAPWPLMLRSERGEKGARHGGPMT